MKKIISVLSILSMLAVAAPAFAATISNPLFSNGQTTIDATGNSTVSGTYTLTVGSGEVVEWRRTQSDTMPFVDTSVGGQLGYQEGVYTNVPFSSKVAPNTGTYNVYEQLAGTYGGNRSINGGDNVILGATNLGTVRVVANASDTSTVSGSMDDSFWTKIAGIIAAAFKANAPAPAPAASAKCAELSADMSAGTYGTYTDSNSVLQGFLLSNHASIPALKAGAAFGFWGTQTQAGIVTVKGALGCN